MFAFTRPGDAATQAFARSLGATWAGGSNEMPPQPLDAAIIFATVGELVPLALQAVRRSVRTWRDYVAEARFIVLLPGERPAVQAAAAGLRDPIWGVWLGRKSCIPSSPVLVSDQEVSVFNDEDCAWRAALRFVALLGVGRFYPAETSKEQFARVCDAGQYQDGTDTWNDAPLGFGRPGSSGIEDRRFCPRRVKMIAPTV